MATPPFSLRLQPQARKDLSEMARIYGAHSAGGFAAEMITKLCSGKQEDVSYFVGRLMNAIQQQMTLDFAEHIKAMGEKSLTRREVVASAKSGRFLKVKEKRRGRRAKRS